MLAQAKELGNTVTYSFNRCGLSSNQNTLYFQRLFHKPDGITVDVRTLAFNLSAGTWTITAKSTDEKTGGTVLYDTSADSPNYGTVTLSAAASGFTYFEIFAMTDDKHQLYQKVLNPEGAMVSFSAALVGSANFFTKCKVYLISGTSMTTATYASNEMAGLWGTHNSSTYERNNAYIGIYRVVGVK